MRRRKDRGARLAFVLSSALIVFAYGIVVGHYRIFPFTILQFGKRSVHAVLGEKNTVLRTRPDHFLSPARHPGSGVTRVDAESVASGLTLLAGFFDRNNEVRLIRTDGVVIRRWPLRFHRIFPRPGHVPDGEVPMTDWNVELHGTLALPDGSVVFNFEYAGMVKIDRCGNVQWKLNQRAHHAVELAADGGFWVPGQRYMTDRSSLPFLDPPHEEEFLWKVSADGRVVREISVLELFRANQLLPLLFFGSLPPRKIPIDDATLHLNDIKELSEGMARHFPQFAAGDLMVSFRDRNMIMVLDPARERVKWSQMGPWLGQHDPQFKANGRISVFSNNNDGTDTGNVLGGSSILEVDPRSGDVIRTYGGVPEQRMYTRLQGKHQNLWNGNTLITESQAGRVFEVRSDGTLVWEFINRYDADSVAVVTQAIRYPDTYFTVREWSCPGDAMSGVAPYRSVTSRPIDRPAACLGRG